MLCTWNTQWKMYGWCTGSNHLKLALPPSVLAIQCYWRNDIYGFIELTYNAFLLITPFLFFQYKATWHVSAVGCFAEFLIIPKRDTKTRRPDPFFIVQAYVVSLAGRFQIILKHWFHQWISPDLTRDTKYTKLD